MVVIYLGFRGFSEHKRGVENVIDFQSKLLHNKKKIYIHLSGRDSVYKHRDFICIAVSNNWLKIFKLNTIIFKLLYRHKNIRIHSHNPLLSFFIFFKKTDILTVHDGLYYLSRYESLVKKNLFKIIERLVYFKCRQVHFISKFTKENTLFGKRKNYVIIPNTSHLESFVTSKAIIESNNIKQDEARYHILIVRSIERRARIDLVLDVAVAMKGKPVWFNIAGKGPLLEEYVKIAEEKNIDNVSFLGYVTDEELVHLYEKCGLVLMTADYGEGFGLPIIEAYLFDKPVIASNKCAIPESIISTDFLFENTVESIIDRIYYAQTCNLKGYRDFYRKKYSNVKVRDLMKIIPIYK